MKNRFWTSSTKLGVKGEREWGVWKEKKRFVTKGFADMNGGNGAWQG